jgi:clan AA aspartic protease (TIGR02281 family)
MITCGPRGSSFHALHHRNCRTRAWLRRLSAPLSFQDRPGAGARSAGSAHHGSGSCRRRPPAFGRYCDAQGHFDVDGRVNGRRIDFVVDTGASVVALTARDAARLGIHPSRNAFAADVKTANGTVRAAPARLDVVQIGSLELRDVTALVLPDDALSDNLLGLSFLSRLHRFEYSDGKLVLEQ